MISVATRPSAAPKWPPALQFPVGNRVAASFEALISSFSRSASGVSAISFILYSFATFIAITLPAWIFSISVRKNNVNEPNIPAAGINGESPEYEKNTGTITDDPGNTEEIQLHETLLASMFTSKTPHNAQEPISDKRTLKPGLESQTPHPNSFCEICLENKDSWQMFANEQCSHAFCYECTQSHILSKIQDGAQKIPCPAFNCKDSLNRDACRLMVPNETLVQWDESLCISLIPESQKIYCPFRDCLAMLVNDSGEVAQWVQCPVCNRAFCGECRVPWHSKFTCSEFRKVYKKKRGGDDRLAKALAKKMNWQKCPKCRMYVEKSEGCVHMTCRCSYEFCYRCGAKWSDTHGTCSKRWWVIFR